MTCNDCSTNNTCRGGHGSFAESDVYETYSSDVDCGPGGDYSIVHTVNPQSGSGENYDEVEGAYKEIYLNSWWRNRPENTINSWCRDHFGFDRYGNCRNVEFYIRHPPNKTDDDYKFEDLRPDQNGNNQNFIVNTALDMIAGVASNALVSTGTAVLKNYIGSWSQSSVQRGAYPNDTTRDYAWWDIDHKSSFSKGPCDTTGVNFELIPGVGSGNHSLNTWSRYTYGYTDYNDYATDCVCAADQLSGVIKTTDWLQNQVSFTFDT